MNSDQASDLFFALTPDKVLEAVEAGGLRCNPVCYPLNSFENRVYEVELADRSRIIAKFYRPGRWTEAQILEEHRFIDDLVADEIPACPVRRFPDGATLKQQEHIYYTLAERRGGRAPDELNDETVERLGMLVGRMHNVAVTSPAEPRLRLNADNYMYDNLDWLEDHDTLPETFRESYLDTVTAIARIFDDLMKGVETHRIHGDLHLGNLLFRDGQLNVLDFDDMAVGPAVQDLWLALPGRDAYSRRQRECFLEGYQRFRPFDRATLKLIEPLRALRRVHYATWLARRWHDPMFPLNWPHFGTENYWAEETQDMLEAHAIIRQEILGEVPPEPEEELTNKDYFWDME